MVLSSWRTESQCVQNTWMVSYQINQENSKRLMLSHLPGGSLDKYSKIPGAVLGRVAFSVVKGLQYLWSLKILHRGL